MPTPRLLAFSPLRMWWLMRLLRRSPLRSVWWLFPLVALVSRLRPFRRLRRATRSRKSWMVVAITVALACSGDSPAPTNPDPDPDPDPDTTQTDTGTSGWGVMGDSGADEYRADDNRGGAYAATTLNWLELLVRYRDFDLGPWGTRAEPRRTGYAQNWARSGATAGSLISSGQHTGLAAQIEAGLVKHVFLQIGANDFSNRSNYEPIYSGALAGAALQQVLDGIYDDITLALATVKAAGAENIFWATIADRGLGPVYAELFPNAAGRQLVAAAIESVNDRVAAYALANDIVVIDVGVLGASYIPNVTPQGFLLVGGVPIDFLNPGDEPHHIILGDREHAGTVIGGLMANYFIAAFNSRGLGIEPFTPAEILTNAGITAFGPSEARGRTGAAVHRRGVG